MDVLCFGYISLCSGTQVIDLIDDLPKDLSLKNAGSMKELLNNTTCTQRTIFQGSSQELASSVYWHNMLAISC